MRRRQFITLVGGAAGAWVVAARAQQSSNRIPVVGVLWHAGSAEEEDVYLSVLVKAFNDLGYVEGKNIHLDHRFPAENPVASGYRRENWSTRKPDVIIAVTGFGAAEAKRATSTIPIVFTLAAWT
jgi:putative tryptophan/tyrosine transport system substrate-binding protein